MVGAYGYDKKWGHNPTPAINMKIGLQNETNVRSLTIPERK